MTLMLNSPGEDVAASPAPESAEKKEVSPLSQIMLIGIAGLYLFGVVWLYVEHPWIAAAGTGVAAIMILVGTVRHLRVDSSAPSGPDS
ncbi:MAG: hypothetical protein OEQ74_06925 [Gammaproteobacteria bacterium]|nr:hypothetical protein [Gammaproteobacteria bacterium]